jgi:carbohydrate-selective porin OprB
MGSLRLSGVSFASCAFLCALVFNVRAEEAAERPVSFLDQLRGKVPKSIAGNPAAENNLPGTGLAGRVFHLPEKSGLRLGGLWLADTNGLISGGAEPGKWSWNSALVVGANLDAQELIGGEARRLAFSFSNSTARTPTAKPAACRATTACPAQNR